MVTQIISISGQSCNKFWSIANFYAESIEEDHNLVVLSPDISFRDYPNMQNNRIIKFPFYNAVIFKLIGYNKAIKGLKFIFENKLSCFVLKIVFNKIPRYKYCQISTGQFKSKFKNKYYNEIKTLFTPNREITIASNCLVNNIKANSDLILGVHIRYGDYKYYKNGVYMYTLNQYRTKIEEVIKSLGEKKVSIFISSNEKLDLKVFDGLNIFMNNAKSATSDLYTLGLCDMIIGPPSTFSGWASYLNEIPIYFIEEINNTITTQSFKSIKEIWNE